MKTNGNGKEPANKKTKKTSDAVNRIVSEVTEKGKSLLGEGWDSAKDVFEENAKTLKDKAGELSDKSVDEISEDVKYYVRRHPVQSLAIAVGLGFVLGSLFKSDS